MTWNFEIVPNQNDSRGNKVIHFKKVRPVYEHERLPIAFLAPASDGETEVRLHLSFQRTIGL